MAAEYTEHFQNFRCHKASDSFDDQFNTDVCNPIPFCRREVFESIRSDWWQPQRPRPSFATVGQTVYLCASLWNAKLAPYSDGYFDPYYDGLLYLFALMHLSGNYRIIH